MTQQENQPRPTIEQLFDRLTPGVREKLNPSRTGAFYPAEDRVSRWHLIVVPFEDSPKVMRYQDEQCMLQDLQKYVGQEVQCFPFFGVMGRVTEPPFPHFAHPDGRMLPLYERDPVVVLNDDYYMGDREQLEVMKGDQEDTESANTEDVMLPGTGGAYEYGEEDEAEEDEPGEPWGGLSVVGDEDEEEEILEHEPD